jgi:geranylgeranyl diphosphate synthase type II
MSSRPAVSDDVTAPAADPLAVASLIDPYLIEFLSSRGYSANLHDAAAYALLGPGKRFRPVLCMQSCIACGGTASMALAPAAALELVHCFSLVHDDLPALDNDDLRRGRPTLHRHAGEAMAILTGDLLLTLAFELLAERTPNVAEHVRELSQATAAMIHGQVHDTLGGLDPALRAMERVESIHANKTGALIAASCRMGVLAAAAAGLEVGPGALDAMSRYAQALGLVFQITDDLIDVMQSAEHVGKRTGKDAAAGKLTYPGVLGLEGAQRAAREQTGKAIEALAAFGPRAEPLRMLCNQVLSRTK